MERGLELAMSEEAKDDRKSRDKERKKQARSVADELLTKSERPCFDVRDWIPDKSTSCPDSEVGGRLRRF